MKSWPTFTIASAVCPRFWITPTSKHGSPERLGKRVYSLGSIHLKKCLLGLSPLASTRPAITRRNWSSPFRRRKHDRNSDARLFAADWICVQYSSWPRQSAEIHINRLPQDGSSCVTRGASSPPSIAQ